MASECDVEEIRRTAFRLEMLVHDLESELMKTLSGVKDVVWEGETAQKFEESFSIDYSHLQQAISSAKEGVRDARRHADNLEQEIERKRIEDSLKNQSF